ncbi:MAG: EI24 domain-containing protein [Myxococcota bacterium]
MPRPDFGPPRNALGAFGWAALQLPRAVVWQWRERELRQLMVAPALTTLLVGLALLTAAVLGAGPLEAALLSRGDGLLAGLAWLALRVVLTVVLVVAALLTTWQLQGAIAAASLERMALYVQRAVEGAAPPPQLGALAVVKTAVRSLFPTVRRLVAWALSALAAATLVLVPLAGPVLVVVAQTLIAVLFLSHGAITDNRQRLGLPRRLLLREPALVLGFALALVPLVLVPPLMLVFGGPVAIAGALVALGVGRR